MDFEERIQYVLKANSGNLDINHERIKKELNKRIFEKDKGNNRSFKKTSPLVATLCCLFLFFTGTAVAFGQNPLSVVVTFVHNIGQDKSFGSGYSFDGGLYANEGSTQSSAFNSYGENLNQYVGTDNFPKLNIDNIKISNVEAFVVNKEKQYYYMKVTGYMTGSADHPIHFDIYHNVNQSILFEGQTSVDNKQEIDLSGTQATYVEYSNKNTNGRINYLTWKNGAWTMLLHSMNLSQNDLVGAAQKINSQIKP
jgi:hypothetical protein